MTPLPPDLITRLCEAANAPEGIHTVEALADRWLADHLTDDGDPEEPAWSDLCVFELDSAPETLFAFCLRIIRKATTPWQLGLVAAGPLEDLMTAHGADFIDRIEDQARRSARVRYALTGLWTGDMPEGDTRSRLEVVQSDALGAGLDIGVPLPPA